MAIHLTFWLARAAGTLWYEEGNHTFKKHTGLIFVMFSKKHTGLLFVMFSEEHTGLLFVMFSKKHTGLLFVMFSKEHTGLLFVMFSKETTMKWKCLKCLTQIMIDVQWKYFNF